MSKTHTFKFHKSRAKNIETKKRKKTENNKIKSKPTNLIWGKLGSVLSPKSKKYVRLGTSKSLKIIRDELIRDKEWFKRVKFMSSRVNNFGNQLKKLLK